MVKFEQHGGGTVLIAAHKVCAISEANTATYAGYSYVFLDSGACLTVKGTLAAVSANLGVEVRMVA